MQAAQQVGLSSQQLLYLYNFGEGFCESSKFQVPIVVNSWAQQVCWLYEPSQRIPAIHQSE